MLKKQLVVAVVSLLAAVSAQAAAIAFDGTIGPLSGSTIEGAFTYSEFSGGLFRATGGNPDPNISAEAAAEVGTLSVVRTDGGLFTFDAVDIAQLNFGGARGINFAGFLNGVSVASESILTSATSNLWTTVTPVALSGLQIDELRIRLDGFVTTTVQLERIDNLNLTSVPEPGTLALLGLGLAGLAATRRCKH